MMQDMWEIFIFKLISENQQFCGEIMRLWNHVIALRDFKKPVCWEIISRFVLFVFLYVIFVKTILMLK